MFGLVALAGLAVAAVPKRKQQNFRLDADLIARLEAAVVAGRAPDKSDAVRQALEAWLRRGSPRVNMGGPAPPERRGSQAAGELPAGQSSADPGEAVPARDLAVVLSGRTGMPAALLRRRIQSGSVRVNGAVFKEPLIAVSVYESARIELDGVEV